MNNPKAIQKTLAFWRQWYQRWLQKRIPKQACHRLKHQNIFILPTKAGIGFVGVILLLWLMGTNYQNNLVLAMAFLLLALMVICIHHTYGNLAGLEVRVLKTHPGFVGQRGQVELLIKPHSQRDYDAIDFIWANAYPIRVSLIGKKQVYLSLSVPLRRRGWYQPPRLKVTTSYPLGLLFAWSQLDMDAPILAYPEPIDSGLQPDQQLFSESDGAHHQVLSGGHEDFAEIRDYRAGDSLRSIDWRGLSRGQGLTTRVYEEHTHHYLWLDWDQLPGLSREARLSRLCKAVLKQAESTAEYGLRLPNIEIAPARGQRHQRRLLRLLALFEWESDKQ